MDWIGWIGKRIFVVLKNGLQYSGTVKDANEDFIEIIDKFDSTVTFGTRDISTIQEKAKGGYER